MNMRDGATGKLVWESSAWGPDMFEVELIGLITSLRNHFNVNLNEIHI